MPGLRTDNTTGYRGVYWSEQAQARRVMISIGEAETRYLGGYETPEEAAVAYDIAALKYLGAARRAVAARSATPPLGPPAHSQGSWRLRGTRGNGDRADANRRSWTNWHKKPARAPRRALRSTEPDPSNHAERDLLGQPPRRSLGRSGSRRDHQ